MNPQTTALTEWAAHQLDPLGLTPAQLRHLTRLPQDHPDAQFAPAHLSTPQAVDALHRLRAHHTHELTRVAAYAPILPPHHPIALTISADAATVTTDTGTLTVTPDTALLDALTEVGIHPNAAAFTTLVADAPATMRHLDQITRTHRAHPVAAVTDFWCQRAQHPGSNAVVILTTALPLRWAPGITPAAAQTLSAWTPWLHTDHPLAQARALAAGHTLPDLLSVYPRDSAAWQRATTQGTRPAGADSRREAAIGLTQRSHAAQLYESLRLGDPLVAQLATRTGTLVEGATPTPLPQAGKSTAVVTVLCEQGAARIKAGDRVQGWFGAAGADPQPCHFTAVVGRVEVTPAGQLSVEVVDVVNHGPRQEEQARRQGGQRVTIRPRAVDPFTQQRFLGQFIGHYGAAGNWLGSRRSAPVTRRDVPLDVLIAAASDT